MVRGGGAGRARRFPHLGRGKPRRGPALTRLRSALRADALPGQAGRGGCPAAGGQAEEEREEGAAAGRAPGPEGLHRRHRLAGGNGRGGGGEPGPRGPPAPRLSRSSRESGAAVPVPVPGGAAGRGEPFPCLASPSPPSAAVRPCCGSVSPRFAELGLAGEGCALLPSETREQLHPSSIRSCQAIREKRWPSIYFDCLWGLINCVAAVQILYSFFSTKFKRHVGEQEEDADLWIGYSAFHLGDYKRALEVRWGNPAPRGWTTGCCVKAMTTGGKRSVMGNSSASHFR